MTSTLRTKDWVPLLISIIFSIGILLYIPLADAEIPYHIGLVEQENSELSLNDNYDDLLDALHQSFIDNIDGMDKYDEGLNYTSEIMDKDTTSTVIEEKIEVESKTMVEIEYPTERGIYTVREGMPRNTRHLKEGYWIGSLPDIRHVEYMKEHGIKIIVTLTNTKRSWNPVKQKIQELGIEHIIFPIGSRFPKNVSFYDTLLNYEPDEIFVHCDHGADRSGTFIAYLLARRNHWPIQKALLAMVNHSRIDLNGLRDVLKHHGYSINEDDQFLTSIYSGPYGGIKVRNEGYKRLVSTMLDSYHSTETKE